MTVITTVLQLLYSILACAYTFSCNCIGCNTYVLYIGIFYYNNFKCGYPYSNLSLRGGYPIDFGHPCMSGRQQFIGNYDSIKIPLHVRKPRFYYHTYLLEVEICYNATNQELPFLLCRELTLIVEAEKTHDFLENWESWIEKIIAYGNVECHQGQCEAITLKSCRRFIRM